MRRKIGIFCMTLGVVLVISALSLFAYNTYESAEADRASEELLKEMENAAKKCETESNDVDKETVRAGGYDCIGSLYIPALEVELPVIAEWSYDNLQVAPCRYSGSVEMDNLVIAAHNYRRHFGNLNELMPGDEVRFTDVNGVVYSYEVIEIGTLSATEVEEMTAGTYDLTLFTCTYDGSRRTTVRCERVRE